METDTSKHPLEDSKKELQSLYDKRSRTDLTDDEKSELEQSITAYEARLHRDTVQQDSEIERKKRDEIATGKQLARRNFKASTCTDQFAQVVARFDSDDRSVQAAEFYEFNAKDFRDNGYI